MSIAHYYKHLPRRYRKLNKNLKALLEKRNTLLSEMNGIVDLVESETRSFEEAETSRLAEIKSEVTNIDGTIEQIKEIRGLAAAEAPLDFEKGDAKMEKEMTPEFEVRGLEQYLRGQNGEERRALADANTVDNATEGAAGNGGITVPTSVYDQIIEQLTETSPVFAAARKFGSVTGNLKVAREDGLNDEGFIGETLDATKIKPVLKSVTLTQKRVGAAIQLTNQLINDSGVDIVGYANGRLTRSVSIAIERGILVGAKDPEDASQTFRPIIGDKDVKNIEIEAAGPTVENLLDIYASINPGYLAGSMFIVSRKIFNVMLKLKDGDGSYLVFRDIVNGKPGYTLFGIPVHVSAVLADQADGKEMVFGNINQAYGMLVKKDMNLITVTADTTQALAGGRLAVLDAYMDGAVVNPAAVVTASLKA